MSELFAYKFVGGNINLRKGEMEMTLTRQELGDLRAFIDLIIETMDASVETKERQNV